MSFIAVYDPKDTRKADTFVLDAILSESHTLQNRVTEEARDGVATGDNIINQARRLSITGLVTDAPVREAGAKSEGNRARAAFEKLEELYTKRKTLTVVTRMKRYENMAIESISIPRQASTGKALEFTMSLVQIATVRSRVGAIVAKVKAEGAALLTKAGKQIAGAAASGAAKKISKYR